MDSHVVRWSVHLLVDALAWKVFAGCRTSHRDDSDDDRGLILDPTRVSQEAHRNLVRNVHSDRSRQAKASGSLASSDEPDKRKDDADGDMVLKPGCASLWLICVV